jgi:hypothetical protein
MKKTLFVLLVAFAPVCALAGRAHVTIEPATVDGNPAVRFSENKDYSTVVRGGTAADPVFTFHLLSCGPWTCPTGPKGYLTVSAKGIQWQSSKHDDDSFVLPLAKAAFSLCWRGVGACLDVAGKSRVFLPALDDGRSCFVYKEHTDPYFEFLFDVVQNFSGADDAFWRLRGEKPPLPTPPAGEDFHALATAWRGLAVKPELPEDARKQRVLAEAYLREKDFRGAIDHYEAGVKACPAWPEGWYNLGLLYAETGSYAYAADRMKHYLELMPNAPDSPTARDKVIIWEDKAAKQ